MENNSTENISKTKKYVTLPPILNSKDQDQTMVKMIGVNTIRSMLGRNIDTKDNPPKPKNTVSPWTNQKIFPEIS